MAFQPIEPQTTEPAWPTPRVRSIISRATMLVVGLILLYAAYKCISLSLTALEEARKTQPGRPVVSGWGLPMLLGVLLSIVGGLTTLASVAPIRVMDMLIPKPPATGDRSASDSQAHRWLWWWQ